MKICLRLILAAAILIVLPAASDAQDRKAERLARREARRIENAIRDSLRKVMADEELIDLGYGKVKRKHLTTSVSKVNLDEKSVSGYSDIGQFLMGRVPGLVVTKTGDGYKYLIRGAGTIYGSTDPLFVVDGRTVDDISYLDPNEVAHVEVLKDAASSAIYGTRGSNGVILITTKK